MKKYDVFNGDADGICSLIQLRLKSPLSSTLITGVKRDINLVSKIDIGCGDHLTVLDVSLKKNIAEVNAALNKGAHVFYIDHHDPGQGVTHNNFTSIINQSPSVCTSILVNGYLKGSFPLWAVVGAGGDNMASSAQVLATQHGLNTDDFNSLIELGQLINYNAYGEKIDDLHYHPSELYQTLLNYASPLDFIKDDNTQIFSQLQDSYQQDINKANAIDVYYSTDKVAVYLFPEAKWSRRINGVFVNHLVHKYPDRAHAVCVKKTNNQYVVSVRAPKNNPYGASKFCENYLGGGRESAAGINDLQENKIDEMCERFSVFM
jgi:nanoRNase/pAp phosphatase (c-di-AMP/oligoRNAs hydrolase)